MNQEQCMFNIYNKCCSELASFEIWKGYYKMRFEEFKNFYRLFPEKHFTDSLEIGCGIGYQSAFLSCISDKVVASDIDLGSMVKHSRGLEITRDFIAQTGINNINIVNANAESLPFEDNSFDLIYSSYAFQYVPNKQTALAEIKRVLKPGGYFFCVVPSTGNRINAAKSYYKTLFKKMPAYLFAKKNGKKTIQHEEQMMAQEFNGPKRTRMLPPPDDEANSFFKELLIYTPARWRKLFSDNGHDIILEKNSNAVENNTIQHSYIQRLKGQFSSNGVIIITKK
jgi:ubiquinone/menaquinone biosynthesis C-methylase UbiE